MDNAANDRSLLDNVVISDVAAPQYMIHRMPENSQLLGTELLQSHNGLVVDLAGGDFIPVSYGSEDLLTQDLTEEDRNLAAALVAVQFSQQQKQQQLHDNALPSLVSSSSIGSKVVDEQEIILSEKASNSINNGFLHIVSSDNLYVGKHAIPKLENVRFSGAGQPFSESSDVTVTVSVPIKSEDEKKDSDADSHRIDHRASKKSLPHKKRISRKLKKSSCPTTVKKITCNLCEQTFKTNDEFAQHEILCQTTITPVNPSPFNCQLCGTPFQDQLRFFEHLKKHYEPVSIQHEKQPCEPSETEKQESLLSSLLNLTCIDCNKTFRRQKTFEAHMRDVHSNKLDEFSEPEDLMEGINVVVDANDPHSDNEDDSKAWYREEELHQTEEDLKELEAHDDHICHLCQQPFPLRAILLQHLVTCRSTSGNSEPTAAAVVKKKNKKKGNLQCTECDRVFTHRNSLVYHMRGHSGIRPHQCDQCGKSFFASSALKVHLRLHSGDKPYTCEECGKKFRQWGDLKYHLTSIHSTEKQFQCEYCGKEFARKYSLIVHRRIHTGEKNYKCEYCGKTFRASSYLQNHRRIHTGEKPHTCSVCGKPFRVRSDMKRHVKTHSKEPKSSGGQRFSQKVAKTEEPDIDDESNELHIGEEEEDVAEEILGYEHDPLDTGGAGTSRLHNRNLYINGHELFLVTYPTEIPVRSLGNGEAASSTSTWIHTTDS